MEKKEIVEKVILENKIKELNPMQKEALKMGILEGENLIVSSPTSSGKTLLAELAGLNVTLNKRKKMIYLCPLVALAREKYEDFKRKYQKYGIKVALSVGNYDSADPWLERFDWIIASNEKFDSLIRHEAPWIGEIGLVVADEIHLLDDPSRGPTLEILLTILKEILPRAQILAFSATIRNAEEIGEWLGAKVLKSSFRPVPLYKGILFGGKIKLFGFKEYKLSQELGLEESVVENTLLMKKQLIFFLSSRRNAEALAERLSKIVFHFLEEKEAKELKELAKKIENALEIPTEQCKKLSRCVEKGVAFYHSGILFSQRVLIEEAYKKGLIKVITSTTALCVHPDTLVYCKNGILKKIKEVQIGERVLVFDFTSFNFKFAKVINKVIRPLYKNEQLFEITTFSGKKIITTYDHPFLTLKDGKFYWTPVSKLTRGDYVAVSRAIPQSATKTFSFFEILPSTARIADKKIIKFILKELLKKYGTQKNISKKFKINLKKLEAYFYRDTTLPLKYFQMFIKDLGIKLEQLPQTISLTTWKKGEKIKLNRNLKILARLYGILLGDGSLLKVKSFREGETYLISLTSSDKKWLKQYQNLLKKIGIETKIKSNSKFPELKYVSFKSKILGEILNKKLNFPTGRKAKQIKIAPFFMSSDELLKEVIGGLIDTDGSVSQDKIEVTSISKDLITQLQLLLLKFGIYSHVEKRKKRITYLVKSKSAPYRLSIFGKSAILFKKNFKLLHYRKRKKLKSIKEKSSKYSKDIIPQSDFFIPKILSETGLSQWKFRKITNLTPYNYLIRKQNLLRETVFKNLSRLKNSNSLFFLQKLANSPLSWEQIKSIRRAKKSMVCDLTTTNNFWANGFIVHNSYGVNLPNFRAVIRDVKRYYPGIGSIYLPVLEVEQMFGRSGRPQFDTWGEGILVAKNREDARELENYYIRGELEEISSKISTESALRMHILSLISNRFCKSQNQLFDFLKKTFFGKKFKEISILKEKVEEVIFALEDWQFIKTEEIKEDGEVVDKKLMATRIGKRISQLYLDPASANLFIENLKDCQKANEFTIFCLLAKAEEMKPSPNLSMKDAFLIEKEIFKNEEYFFFQIPDELDNEYEEFLREAKLATIFSFWIEEKTEGEIMEKLKMTPGELHSRIEILDWLLYSILEISKLIPFNEEIKKMLKKLRIRAYYGIKEELIPLVSLKGIGRIRARVLFDAGLKNISDLKKASVEKIAKVLKSKSLAEKIRKQIR
jgi:replicative superfamily II helicase